MKQTQIILRHKSIVPTGVTSLYVRLWGAGGAGGIVRNVGGGGAFVSGDLSVTSGEQLSVLVGGEGAAYGNGGAGGGGYGGSYGGVNAGGGGGGRSALLLNGVELEDVGGGGGGGGGGFYGGGGGGDSGGGGSSYVANLTNVVSSNGTGPTPGGTGDPFYIAGVGSGGAAYTNGGNGEIVLTYIATPTPDSLAVFASIGFGAAGMLVRKRRGQ